MEQYLIDTNAVCDYLAAEFSPAGMAFMDSVIDTIPNIAVITQIELLCWNTDEETTTKVKNFIADSVIFNIDDSIITTCATIRKAKKIKTPDAIIAATAIAYSYTLITNNTNDFKNISSLKMVNPWSM